MLSHKLWLERLISTNLLRAVHLKVAKVVRVTWLLLRKVPSTIKFPDRVELVNRLKGSQPNNQALSRKEAQYRLKHKEKRKVWMFKNCLNQKQLSLVRFLQYQLLNCKRKIHLDKNLLQIIARIAMKFLQFLNSQGSPQTIIK